MSLIARSSSQKHFGHRVTPAGTLCWRYSYIELTLRGRLCWRYSYIELTLRGRACYVTEKMRQKGGIGLE